MACIIEQGHAIPEAGAGAGAPPLREEAQCHDVAAQVTGTMRVWVRRTNEISLKQSSRNMK